MQEILHIYVSVCQRWPSSQAQALLHFAMSNSFSISSPTLVFSTGHTAVQEAGATGTQKKRTVKAEISTSIFQRVTDNTSIFVVKSFF